MLKLQVFLWHQALAGKQMFLNVWYECLYLTLTLRVAKTNSVWIDFHTPAANTQLCISVSTSHFSHMAKIGLRVDVSTAQCRDGSMYGQY